MSTPSTRIAPTMRIDTTPETIPAHMPTDAPAAVLMAQVIAHDALNRAMRRAQSLDAGFHEDLARMDILASVGMLDREFVEQACAEVVAQFHAAVDALCTGRREAPANA